MRSEPILGLFHRLQCTGDTSLQPRPELSQLLDTHIRPQGQRVKRGMGEAVGNLVSGGDEIYQYLGYLAKHHQLIRRPLPFNLFESLPRACHFLLFVFKSLARERSNCAAPASEFAGRDDSGERHLPAASHICVAAFALSFCQLSGGILLGLVDNGAKECGGRENCLRPASRRRPPVEWMAEQIEGRAVNSLRHVDVDHGQSLPWARCSA